MTSYPFALLSGLISSWLGALSTDCHIGSMLTSNTLLQNRYLIIRLLAQGGMGAVYEARDQRLNTTVALKETFFTDEAFRQAFHREASLLATLRHQALPKVIDHFAENDGQFLVMEFIRGDDLSRLLEIFGRPIPVRDVLAWADQLLGALEYLHAQRPPIIHRDIKPQNLKLNERGEIVLLDFGLAKEEALTTSQYNRSVRGYTLNYAPLEQIQGTGTEPRSDLYSAAATFYHLLTGVVPPDAVTRATALVESQPDPLRPAHELNPRVPVPVSDVLQQALAQDRNRRPANAAKLRAALRQAASALLAATPAETPGATAPIPPAPR
jgi:serine/threonine protein kinase